MEQEFTVRQNGEVPSNWKSRVHKRLTTRRPRPSPITGEGSGDTSLNSWAHGSAVICSVGLQIGLC